MCVCVRVGVYVRVHAYREYIDPLWPQVRTHIKEGGGCFKTFTHLLMQDQHWNVDNEALGWYTDRIRFDSTSAHLSPQWTQCSYFASYSKRKCQMARIAVYFNAKSFW